MADEDLGPKSDVSKSSLEKDDLLGHLDIFDLSGDIQIFSPDINIAPPHVFTNTNGRDGVNLKRTWDSSSSIPPESLLFRHSDYERILVPPFTTNNQTSSGFNEKSNESENRGQFSSFAPALLLLLNHDDERQKKRRRFDNSNHPNPHSDSSRIESNPTGTSEKLCHSHPDVSSTLAKRVAELKRIYAALVIVEAKCIEIDKKQATLALDTGSDAEKLNSKQWQDLTALHRTLLCEHFEF